MTTRFLLNRQSLEAPDPAHAVLLDSIRSQSLTGTKEACREGDCGACQILLGGLSGTRLQYQAVNACLLPVGAVSNHHVVTIEGLNDSQLNPIQQALVAHGAVQCGFCSPGLVIALTGFFLSATASEPSAALDAVAGNLCRCTGYAGINRAIKQLCLDFDLACSPLNRRIDDLIEWRILPAYFANIGQTLATYPPEIGITPPDNAVLLAGGTDLFVQHPKKLYTHPVRWLSPKTGHPVIRQEQNIVVIDALATVEQLRTAPLLQRYLPDIAEDFKKICSAPVRQRATLGGNLANASPIGDLSVFFLALNARLILACGQQTRTLALKDFFNAYKQTDLQAHECIIALTFETLEPEPAFSYEKVSKRTYLDIASVNSALCLQQRAGIIEQAHLSAGGVAPYPLYLDATCRYLQGQPLMAETIQTAVAIAQSEIAPVSDLRGSAHYKRLLLKQLIYAHFLKLFPNLIRWETLHNS